MPFVPLVPGVPPLTSYAPFTSVGLLVTDALAFLSSLFGPQWGIFLDGFPIIISDNVVSLDFKQEWTVSDYPVEEGQFETYDKVQTPFEARVRFSAGGSEQDRFNLLQSIAAISDGVTLLDVVTPEQVYSNVTIYHYDYKRTAQNGVGLIQVDVWCMEVRQTTQTMFSNTQSPSGASSQGSGFNQAQTPTSNQQSSTFE